MKLFRKNLMALVLGIVALALVAGIAFASLNQPTVSAAPAAQATATSASASPSPDKGQQALDNFTKTLAAKLNVDEAKLNSAFSEAASETADQAVKDGTINQTQANFIKGITKNGFKSLLDLSKTTQAGMGGGTGFGAKAGMGGAKAQEAMQYLMPIVTEVSKVLKLSPIEILGQLQADKSLADIAKAQNVDLQTVKDAITTSIKTQLETAVKANKLTQAQSDKANQTIATWLDEVVKLHKSALPTNSSPKELEQYYTPVLNAVASSLNLSPEQLKSELQSGKSLGDLAKAQKVELQKVKDAILSSSKMQLNAAATAGKFTQSQADKAYQTLTAWIDEIVK